MGVLGAVPTNAACVSLNVRTGVRARGAKVSTTIGGLGRGSVGKRDAHARECGDDVIDPGLGPLEPYDDLPAGVGDRGRGMGHAVA